MGPKDRWADLKVQRNKKRQMVHLDVSKEEEGYMLGFYFVLFCLNYLQRDSKLSALIELILPEEDKNN